MSFWWYNETCNAGNGHGDSGNGHNKAIKCGGGLYVENGVINIMQDIYDNNIAGDYGGGLVTNSIFTQLMNVNKNNNSAVNYGGGIYIQECPEYIWEGLQFDDNNKAVFM